MTAVRVFLALLLFFSNVAHGIPSACAPGMALEADAIAVDESALENAKIVSLEEVQEARESLLNSKFVNFLEAAEEANQARIDVLAQLANQKKYDLDITPEQYESYLKWYKINGDGNRRNHVMAINAAIHKIHFSQAMALTQDYYETYADIEGKQFVDNAITRTLDLVTFSNEGSYYGAFRSVTNTDFKEKIKEQARAKWRFDPSWRVLFK